LISALFFASVWQTMASCWWWKWKQMHYCRNWRWD